MQVPRFPETAIPRWACSSPGSRPHQGFCSREIRSLMGTAHAFPFEELVQRVRTAYIDTPSLRLTLSQAQRRFGMAPSAWVAVLDTLLAESFLSRTSDGLFVRRHPPSGRAARTAEARGPVH